MINFKEEKKLKDYDSVSLASMLRSDFIRLFPAWRVEQLDNAIQVASYLHRHDVRRGARGSHKNPPYIEHPLRVAVRALRTFSCEDPDSIIAYVLHDTVEDHAYGFADFDGCTLVRDSEEGMRREALRFISTHFGHWVSNTVKLMSNPPLIPGTPKSEKVMIYHQHVSESVKRDTSVLIGKISDFKDNAGSLHHHYSYGDPKVDYFLDRYEPLIPVYRDALQNSTNSFNVEAALEAIAEVESQFERFRSAA